MSRPVNRLYETDSYIRKYETTVSKAGNDDKGRFWVCLEDTVFFPEEGGQRADTGFLIPLVEGKDAGSGTEGKKICVLDGVITGRSTCSAASTEQEISIKYIVSEPVAQGTRVLCLLDWDKRYDRMQNHSGEHIVSGLMHSRHGFDNVGFHLSDTGFVTLDFNGVLTYEQVIDIEKEANRVVYANMPVRDSYPSAEELKNMEYRSKIDIDGQVRLITIGNDEETVDVCACCAPHVARTGEIGIIKIMSVINWKGGIRVSMLCGRRALEHINMEHDILTETAKELSTETVNVPGLVRSRIEEITELKAKLASAMEKGIYDRIEAGAADKAGCVFVPADLPAASMKNVYNALTGRLDGYVGVFAGDDAAGYRYYAGSRNGDSRLLASKLKDAFGAKGGGSAEMIQGKVMASSADIDKFFGELGPDI